MRKPWQERVMDQMSNLTYICAWRIVLFFSWTALSYEPEPNKQLSAVCSVVMLCCYTFVNGVLFLPHVRT